MFDANGAAQAALAKARANAEALAAVRTQLGSLYTTHHRNIQAMINGYLHNTPTAPGAAPAAETDGPDPATAAAAAAGPTTAASDTGSGGGVKRKRELDDEA